MAAKRARTDLVSDIESLLGYLRELTPSVSKMSDVMDYYRWNGPKVALQLMRAGYGVNGAADGLVQRILGPLWRSSPFKDGDYELVDFIASRPDRMPLPSLLRFQLWVKSLVTIRNIELHDAAESSAERKRLTDLMTKLFPILPSDSQYLGEVDQLLTSMITSGTETKDTVDGLLRDLFSRFVLLRSATPDAAQEVDRGITKYYNSIICDTSSNLDLTGWIDSVYLPLATDGTDGINKQLQLLIKLNREKRLMQLLHALSDLSIPGRVVPIDRPKVEEIKSLINQGVGKCYHGGSYNSHRWITDPYLVRYYTDVTDVGNEVWPSTALALDQFRRLFEYPGDKDRKTIDQIVSSFDPSTNQGALLYDYLKNNCTSVSPQPHCEAFLRRFPADVQATRTHAPSTHLGRKRRMLGVATEQIFD